jgi:anti-anti-sigma regulatory factor
VIGKKWSRETSPCYVRALTATAVLSRPQLNTTVCTVTGTLHTGTTPVLREALVEAQHDDNAHLVIDLSTIRSMDVDAAGLRTLLEARYTHDINGSGLMAVVVDSNSQAISELHIVTLEVTFDLHHNLTDALHACAVAKSVHTPDKGRSAIDRIAVV